MPRSPSAGSPPVTRGHLMDFPDDPVACMRRLHARHGDLAALQEGDQRVVFVFGPAWNQRVLTDVGTFHSRFFAVRGPRGSAQRRLTSGLLSMNGAEHKQHRRMVMGPFQKRTIATYHDAVSGMTAEMLEGWRVGEVRDIDEEMTQYMLRLTSSILFGFGELELAYRIGERIDRWVHLNHETGLGVLVPNERFRDGYARLLAMADELEADIRRMLELRRAGTLGNDVLSLLIRAHQQEQKEVDDEKLIGHAALLFGAAHLTTAHTLTWTLFLLAQHPSIMRQVDEEIRAHVSGAVPEVEELAGLTVLERVIKESMRILPASGYSQRMAVKPVRLGSLGLARGTPVIFSQFITHHMPELYAEPEHFRPDRWLQIAPSPYEYLPFGAGPRMCLGGPLAMMILKTALPMILGRYRLSVVPGAEISGKIVSTMLGPTGPVPMRVSAPDAKFEAAPVSGNIHTMVRLAEVPGETGDTLRRAA